MIRQRTRRGFIALLGAAAGWPVAVGAQRGTVARIGILAPGRSVGADASLVTLNSFVMGLRELGYTEGQNIAIERAFGEANPDRPSSLKEAETAADSLGLQLQFVEAATPEKIEGAFSLIARHHADALSVFPSPILFAEYGRIAVIAAERKLPVIYAAREGVEAGGLMSYGANLSDLARQTATYVDRIIKGAKPASLPVQQPTKFELVINLKVARALGLTITRDFLLIADEVIE
jgi:ABC-type uncharacterized transport system substrate-binding protein